ncbi:molybdate ABC transporter substrate-binding protein [Pusillimonas sp.]|uniref:molybdate ABC transporter substrate-binding protein n=1 Tax=Pusillimonas sp. TaxID=3040095 RepID=UPI0039C9CA46
MRRPFPIRSVLARAALLIVGGVLSCRVAAGELTVSAAASLTNAFRELATQFEARHANMQVQLNFAGSGALVQQIALGAPVDVLACADEATMDRAQQQGLIDVTQRRDFASNQLVVIVPKGDKAPGSLDEIAQLERVAIARPASVPVGRYAQIALDQAGLWNAIQPRVIGAQSARQVLDYVARGEVDAGFVYATDAAAMSDKVSVAFMVSSSGPILYPVAPVKGSSAREEAALFIDFIHSPEARAVLAKHGFGMP